MLYWLERHIPKLVLAPSLVISLIFVYGFIAWTAWVSLTKSKLMPRYEIVGLLQYDKLFLSPSWETALENLLFLVVSLFCLHDSWSCSCHFFRPKNSY